MERLANPKVLHCNHSYCKTCLDNILQFRGDGSGFIVCPVRCEGQTEVKEGKTTNDLNVPVQLKSLMELVEDEIVE